MAVIFFNLYLVTADIIKYRHKITPYEGRIVKGIVKRTVLRGKEVYRDGEILGDPAGQPILRHDLAK